MGAKRGGGAKARAGDCGGSGCTAAAAAAAAKRRDGDDDGDGDNSRPGDEKAAPNGLLLFSQAPNSPLPMTLPLPPLLLAKAEGTRKEGKEGS